MTNNLPLWPLYHESAMPIIEAPIVSYFRRHKLPPFKRSTSIKARLRANGLEGPVPVTVATVALCASGYGATCFKDVSEVPKALSKTKPLTELPYFPTNPRFRQ